MPSIDQYRDISSGIGIVTDEEIKTQAQTQGYDDNVEIIFLQAGNVALDLVDLNGNKDERDDNGGS